MNPVIVTAIAAMAASTLGSFVTAAWAFLLKKFKKRQDPGHELAVNIKSSDGHEVNIIVAEGASEAELGEAIAQALRQAQIDETNSPESRASDGK